MLAHQLVTALQRYLSGAPSSVPEAGHDLWRIFADLCTTRTYHLAGPNPISFAEIEAYCRLYRWPLQPHHVAVIRALDDAWLGHARSPAKPLAGGGGQQLIPSAFDAVFG